MVVLVKIFGVLILFAGIVVLIRPSILKDLLIFWQQGNRLWSAVLMRLVMGSIFVAAAPQCRLPGVIMTVGVVVLVSGIAGSILGLDRLRSLVQWYLDRSPIVWRFWAVLSVVFGLLVLYAS